MKPIFERDEYKDIDWNVKDKSIELDSQEAFDLNRKKAILKMAERQRRNELREINSKDRYVSDRMKKFTTSKLLMYIIFLNCLMIEIYSMWAMYKLADLSALYSLIGAVIGESITYAIYCAKSFSETREEEKLKFEREKLLNDTDDIPDEVTKESEDTFDNMETDDTNNEEEVDIDSRTIEED